MFYRFHPSILGFLILFNSCASPSARADHQLTCDGKPVLGGVERIQLMEQHMSLNAKIDTGAAMSSLSADDIKLQTRHHAEWVSFTVSAPDTHEKITFMKPLMRHVRILKRSEESMHSDLDDKQYSNRPVVQLDICIGNQRRIVEVNLADRSHFKYPMLIGSGTLKKLHAIVDPSVENLKEPSC